MKLNETSQEKVFEKRTRYGLYFCNWWHQIVEYSSFRLFGRTKQTAHRAIKFTTLDSFSMRRWNWTEGRIRTIFSFLLNDKLKSKFFCWQFENGAINFRGAIFNPSTVNLGIVYTITAPFVTTLRQPVAFTFLERSYENTMYVSFVRACNNLISWNEQNFDPLKGCFEHKSTEFVNRKRLRACRRSKFNRQTVMLYL